MVLAKGLLRIRQTSIIDVEPQSFSTSTSPRCRFDIQHFDIYVLGTLFFDNMFTNSNERSITTHEEETHCNVVVLGSVSLYVVRRRFLIRD